MLWRERSGALAGEETFAAAAVRHELKPAVRALHYDCEAPRRRPFRRLPWPFAALVVTLDDPGRWRPAGGGRWRSYPRLALHGLFTVWSESAPSSAAPVRRLIALIEPWAMKPLFGLAASSSVDRVIDLEQVQAPWSPALLRRVRLSREPAERLAVLQSMLIELAGSRPTVPGDLGPFLDAARASAGAIHVGQAAERCGLAERRFRRLVEAEMGLPPKRWCMIERFSANLRRLHPNAWEQAAAPPDYSDQAHEIREFRLLAGMAPGAYRREKLAGDRRVYAVL